MSPHDQLIKPEEAQENISSTIDRGRVFLLLAGSIGIVLAAVALAMASHLFATKQKTQVALLKSWGLTESRVRKLYVNQSLFLGFVGSFIGLFLGCSPQVHWKEEAQKGETQQHAVHRVKADWLALQSEC